MIATCAVGDDHAPREVAPQRVVVEAIRCIDEAHGVDAVRTVVIEDGRIAAIVAPETFERSSGDRIVRGEARIMVPGRTISCEGQIEALWLRRQFVDGVTTVELPDLEWARCLASLADRPTLRMPRVRIGPPPADVPRGIAVGAVADLVIYHQDRRPPTKLGGPADGDPVHEDLRPRLLITAHNGVGAGGVEIVFPGEIHRLDELVTRLSGLITQSIEDFPAMARRLGQAPVDIKAVRRGIYSVDALPRGVIWTWTTDADGEVADYTLIRRIEPFDLWCLVIERESAAGQLRRIELAIFERGRGAVEHFIVDFGDGRMTLRDSSDRTGSERDAPIDPQLDCDGCPVMLVIDGVTSARTIRRSDQVATGPDAASDDHEPGLLVVAAHLTLEPNRRGITPTTSRMQVCSEALCVPGSSRASQWQPQRPGALEIMPSDQGVDGARIVIWTFDGTLVGCLAEHPAGLIGFAADGED